MWIWHIDWIRTLDSWCDPKSHFAQPIASGPTKKEAWKRKEEIKVCPRSFHYQAPSPKEGPEHETFWNYTFIFITFSTFINVKACKHSQLAFHTQDRPLACLVCPIQGMMISMVRRKSPVELFQNYPSSVWKILICPLRDLRTTDIKTSHEWLGITRFCFLFMKRGEKWSGHTGTLGL